MKIEVTIPESKSDIKLKDFIKFQSLLGKDNDEDFINQKMLEIFYNITYEQYRSMNINDYSYLLNAINASLRTKSELRQIIVIDDKEYGFIPRLDNMTTGELIDCDNYLRNSDYYSLLAVLYRPIVEKKGNKYIIEPYKNNNSELFKDIDLETYEGVIAFFFHLLKQLEETTQKYLEKELKKVKNPNLNQTEDQMKIFQQNLNLVRSGIPTFNYFGNLVEEIY